MEKLFKIAKILFVGSVIVYAPILAYYIFVPVLIGHYYDPSGQSAFFDFIEDILGFGSIYLFLVPFVPMVLSILFFIILPFWVLVIYKKTDPQNFEEENYISRFHIFLFFAPLFSMIFFLLWLWASQSPTSPPCDVLTFQESISFVEKIASRDLLRPVAIAFSVIFSGFFMFSSVILLMLKWRQRKGRRAIRIAIIIGFLLVPLLLSFFLTSLNTVRRKSRDARRIADIKQIQLALELYLDASGLDLYPSVGGATPQERWSNLSPYLVNKHIPALPIDPLCDGERFPEHQYDYKNSPDGTSYVARVILDSYENPALENDVDGDVFGIQCGEQGREREYCVAP